MPVGPNTLQNMSIRRTMPYVFSRGLHEHRSHYSRWSGLANPVYWLDCVQSPRAYYFNHLCMWFVVDPCYQDNRLRMHSANGCCDRGLAGVCYWDLRDRRIHRTEEAVLHQQSHFTSGPSVKRTTEVLTTQNGRNVIFDHGKDTIRLPTVICVVDIFDVTHVDPTVSI